MEDEFIFNIGSINVNFESIIKFAFIFDSNHIQNKYIFSSLFVLFKYSSVIPKSIASSKDPSPTLIGLDKVNSSKLFV